MTWGRSSVGSLKRISPGISWYPEAIPTTECVLIKDFSFNNPDVYLWGSGAGCLSPSARWWCSMVVRPCTRQTERWDDGAGDSSRFGLLSETHGGSCPSLEKEDRKRIERNFKNEEIKKRNRDKRRTEQWKNSNETPNSELDWISIHISSQVGSYHIVSCLCVFTV